jgi:myo-inositol-1(or 4)-monophosphatase
MGLIDQPFTGETLFRRRKRHRHYTGPGGDGSSGARLRQLSNAILFTTSPHLFVGEEMEKYREIESQVRLFRYGTDCYAYALLAAGHVDLVSRTA